MLPRCTEPQTSNSSSLLAHKKNWQKHEFSCCMILRVVAKLVKELLFWLKSDKKNGGCTWRVSACYAELFDQSVRCLHGVGCGRRRQTGDMQGKVKQSHYRPWQALRFPAGWGSQIFWQSAHEGGTVVSPTHRPPLPPGNILCTHFC
jgi:hypothetical protein